MSHVTQLDRPSRSTRPRLDLLAAAVLALAAAPAAAVQPFAADYQASYMGVQGTGKMSLVAQGADRWKYSFSIDSPVARVAQSTVFEDVAGQWRPLSSSDSAMLLVKKTSKDGVYDWKKGVATWSGDVKPERAGPVQLQRGDMDAMMINLALARDVAAGRPLSYRMVEDGRVKQLTYEVAGKESITVSGKPTQATRVVRTDGRKQTIAWVVDGLPVPARILQRKDGKDDIDLRIKSVR
jgi:hypothetical protein